MRLASRRSLWITLSTVLTLWGSACASTRYSTDSPPRAFLRLEVEPTSAKVYIDDRYQGQIQGWAQQTIPVQPGLRRVELRSPGYISQRFDLQLAHNEEVSLNLSLERELDELDELNELNELDATPSSPQALPSP